MNNQKKKAIHSNIYLFFKILLPLLFFSAIHLSCTSPSDPSSEGSNENNKKNIYDYSMSSEKETVKNNPKMIAERTFTVNSKKVFFTNHLKNLPNANRIYFLEEENKIYIGYIGSHLSNKHDK